MLLLCTLYLVPLVYSQDIFFPDPSNDPNLEVQTDIENISPSETLQNKEIAKNWSRSIINNINDLGIEINKIESDTYHNYKILSPTSIACALYMILEGANNDTYTQIYNLLGLNPLSYGLYQEYVSNQLNKLSITGHENNIIKIANGLFVQQDYNIRKEYRDSLLKYFRAMVQNLDFRNNALQAREVINSWVSQNTFGKITEILENDPNIDTKIILTNSLYFKGEWETHFPSQLTKVKDFHPYGSSHPYKLKLPFMAVGGTFKYYYDSNFDVQVLGIPYKGREVIFYAILPKESNMNKVENFENFISALEIEKLLNKTKYVEDMVITLPKLKLTSQFNLIPALKKLGVTSLFDSSKSDLSLISNVPKSVQNKFANDSLIFTRSKTKRHVKMSKRDTQKNGFLIGKINDKKFESNSDLYVSQILHKVIIDVNEKGTEAAATTLVTTAKTLSITVRIDSPFLFFIRHEPTNLILFQGTVIKPVD